MFDIGWSEMALIAIVALIFIGPKELPQVLRNVGKWVTAARNMAREFQGHVDDLVRETELDEVRRSIRENTAETLNDLANHIDPDRSLREGLDADKLTAGDAKTPDAAPEGTVAGEPAAAPLEAQDMAAIGAPSGDYHPPSDMPAPDTTPLAPLEPLPATPASEPAKAAAEPAKNAGAPEPGRA